VDTYIDGEVIIVDGNAALFPMSWSKEECEEWLRSQREKH
jgi:hypothetical protein